MARTFYNPYERDPVSTNSSIPGEDKIIKNFDLDLSDIPAAGERRHFTITGEGDGEVEFKLEVRDKDTGKYYNFVTDLFQTTADSLEEEVTGGKYSNSIVFPAVTGSSDQYDIYLYAKPGTKHADYVEARFDDGSLDINGSIGSNSLLMQKVIHQYTALTLTLSGYSIGGTVTTIGGGAGTSEITADRGKGKNKTPFSFSWTAATTAAYRILKQPVANDVLAFLEPTVAADPKDLPGENVYPTARDAFTGDDINGAITSGSVVRMDNTDLSAVIAVGDKITTTTMTDTVNGSVSGGTNVVMDSAVAAKMAVGDQVTHLGDKSHALNSTVVTVTAINVGGSDNTFTLSEAVDLTDGVTLQFSSKINRSTTTVTVVETSGTATDFTMSQAIQFRDNAPLTFFPRKNKRWSLDNYIDIIKDGMIVVSGTNVSAGSSVAEYKDTTTVFSGTKNAKTIVKNKRSAVSTDNKKPTVVKGLVTVQSGDIIFNNQQVLALGGTTLKIGGYGESEILRVYGWDVKFTDLAITLTAPTTTTTEATSAHAEIAVADREGVINNVSRVSGIGINPSAINPLITSGGGADGAGDWTMGVVQTLESGITLTVENTSRIATITGNIEIVKAGNASQTLRFDINKLLSTSA